MKANLYSSNATSTTHVTVREAPLHPCPSCRCKSPNSSVSDRRASINSNNIRFINGSKNGGGNTNTNVNVNAINNTNGLRGSQISMRAVSPIVHHVSPRVSRNVSPPLSPRNGSPPPVVRGQSPRMQTIKFVYDGQSMLARNRSQEIKPSPVRYIPSIQSPRNPSPALSPQRIPPARHSIYYQKYTNEKTPEKPKILQGKKQKPERRKSSTKKQQQIRGQSIARNVFIKELPLGDNGKYQTIIQTDYVPPPPRLDRYASQPQSPSNSRARANLHSNQTSNASSVLPSFSLTPSSITYNQSQSVFQPVPTPSVSIFNYVSSLPPRSPSHVQVQPQSQIQVTPQLITQATPTTTVPIPTTTTAPERLPVIHSIQSVKPIPQIASTPSSSDTHPPIVIIPPFQSNLKKSDHSVLQAITPIDALWIKEDERERQRQRQRDNLHQSSSYKPLTNSQYIRLSQKHTSPTSLQIISSKIQNQQQQVRQQSIKQQQQQQFNKEQPQPHNEQPPSPPLSITKPISNQIGALISKPTSQSIDIYEVRPQSIQLKQNEQKYEQNQNEQNQKQTQENYGQQTTPRQTSLQIITEQTQTRRLSEHQLEYQLAKSITTELDLHYDYYYRTDDSDRSMSVHVEL